MPYKKIQKNYCIGIIPNSFSYSRITELKAHLEKAYKLQNDEHFVPLIKLIEPFTWDEKNEYLLVDYLKKYAKDSYSFDLEFIGFEIFDEQISLKILNKDQIRTFQKSLAYYIEIHTKLVFENGFDSVYEPKLFLNILPKTIRKKNIIWTELKESSFNIHFIANKIFLLYCKSDKWNTVKEFELE